MDRYFVDTRSGCIAVRDHDNTDPRDQGLHGTTQGVVKYWDGELAEPTTCPTCGHSRRHGWVISDEVVKEARQLCNKLNGELSHSPTEPEVSDE